MTRRDDPGDHGEGPRASRCGDSNDKDWIVLLEAADPREASAIDLTSFARLVSSWATPAPTTLYSPSRYALQVAVPAANAPAALSSAISLWQQALRHSGLPKWELVRAEIMTPEESERELESADCATGGASKAEDVLGHELLSLALHDSVTGLAGRELFLDQVREALAVGARTRGIQTVMVVHLDGLRAGDCHAGPASDQVLFEIAGRLATMLRRGDPLARVGPAEFALLIEVPSAEHSDRVAGRIVDSIRRSLPERGQRRSLTGSVGVAMAPSCRDGDADRLFALAEAAMVAARDAGGDCHRPVHARQRSV